MRTPHLALALVLAPLAGAQVVFDNGVPDFVNAYHSDFDTSNPSDTVQVGDNFKFGAPTNFDLVKFWGVYAFDNVPPALDDFTLRVFDLAAPPPTNPPIAERSLGAVARADTGSDLGSFDMYAYKASFAPISLPAGVYLLSIVNDTTGTTSDWFWATTANTPDSWERDSDGSPWIQDDNAYAFSLATSGCSVQYCAGNPDNVADLSVNTCKCSSGSIGILMTGAKPSTFTYLLVSASSGSVTNPPGAAGDLCLVGSAIGRYILDLGATDASGAFKTDVLNAITGGGGGNLPNPPGGNVCNPIGQTWNFQYWYRDAPNPSKFSRALSVTFQ